MSLSGGSCRLCLRVQQDQHRCRRIDDNHPSQQNLLRRQQRLLSSPQPTIMLIYDNEILDYRQSDCIVHENSSMILCKSLPYSVEDCGKKEITNDDVILAFDDSVIISLKDEATTMTLESFLHSFCCNKQTVCSDDDRLYRDYWSLGDDKPDPHTVRRQRQHPNPPRRATINYGMNCGFRHHRLAMPLFFQTILPLKSLIICITAESFPSASTSQNNGNFCENGNPLLQSCWKRQLAGKVIATSDQWSCRIKLYGNADHDKESDHVVYAIVKSYMVSAFACKKKYDRYSKNTSINTMSLPNEFCVILPSTRITIQGYSPPAVSSVLKTNVNHDSSRPPSAAAGLLSDTIDCVRFGSCGVPRSFLLSGPPGCGKTYCTSWLASAHSDTLVVCSIRGSELLKANSTNNELSNRHDTPARALEKQFENMSETIYLRQQRMKNNGITESTTQLPSRSNIKNQSGIAGMIFLDECDALVSVDSVAAMLAYLLDRVSSSSSSSFKNNEEKNREENECWKRIIVVGATNRIDSIPSYLRRAGRFDREIKIPPPSVQERAIIITSLLSTIQNSTIKNQIDTDSSCDKDSTISHPSKKEIESIAELCVGYVAADLSAVVRKAWLLSLRQKGSNRNVTYFHLNEARHLVGASALRDAMLGAPPKITWDDISGDPGGAKTALRQAIEWPRLKAREFNLLGLQPCRGILLHGPPGCAKTMLARAAAGSSGVAFLSLSPAEVYASSYVGEAERIIRQAFHLARSTAPCILFFDEIDSIFDGGENDGSNKGVVSSRNSGAEGKVLSTFLNEMDGVDIPGSGKDGVLVLGATNRPFSLDPALLRPGRLGDKIIFLPPPDKEARRSILQKQLRMNVAAASKDESSWNWDVMIDLTEGMTGAEIIGGCHDAKMRWIKKTLRKGSLCESRVGCKQDDVMSALSSIKPLLSNPEALEEFQVFANREKNA